jgi:hypothetical protein
MEDVRNTKEVLESQGDVHIKVEAEHKSTSSRTLISGLVCTQIYA